MAVGNYSEIGINFNVFQNISTDGFTNLTNLTKEQFINKIPEQANAITNNYYGIIILIVLGLFLIQMLSDVGQYGLFRYSSVRALGISLGIISTFGIVMLNIGYMTNFVHLNSLVTLYVAILVYIIISNPT